MAIKKEATDADLVPSTGTSMAAPHVSGVAAVVLSNFRHLTAVQLSECLLQGATPIIVDQCGMSVALETPVYVLPADIDADALARGRHLYGMGRVNLDGAMQYAGKFLAPTHAAPEN